MNDTHLSTYQNLSLLQQITTYNRVARLSLPIRKKHHTQKYFENMFTGISGHVPYCLRVYETQIVRQGSMISTSQYQIENVTNVTK